jgi:hypothetical protein
VSVAKKGQDYSEDAINLQKGKGTDWFFDI